jgi:hypothetical protein
MSLPTLASKVGVMDKGTGINHTAKLRFTLVHKITIK